MNSMNIPTIMQYHDCNPYSRIALGFYRDICILHTFVSTIFTKSNYIYIPSHLPQHLPCF